MPADPNPKLIDRDGAELDEAVIKEGLYSDIEEPLTDYKVW